MPAPRALTCIKCRSPRPCVWRGPAAGAETHTRSFSALPSGLGELTRWLLGYQVSAALMAATGVYWEGVFDALDGAGIEPLLVPAQHVKQLKGRKTDIADSVWLARICQFGLCTPSFVPPPAFRDLRKVSRQRRKVVRLCATLRTRTHHILDRAGLRVGGVLSDLFGANGRRILDGLAAGRSREDILAALSRHVRPRLAELCDALSTQLAPHARFILRDQLDAFEQARARRNAYDAFIQDRLAPYRNQIDLLTHPARHRPGLGLRHPHRTRSRHPCLPLTPALRRLGRPVPRQQRKRRQETHRHNPQGQHRPAQHPRRVRPRRPPGLSSASARATTRPSTVRRGDKRASVASAHKLLRIIYRMLATGQVYRDPDTDYEALLVKRNAPRWIAMLKKHGMDPATRSTTTQATA